MSATNFLEDAILNVLRGTTFPAVPTNFYVALHTADPGESGAGAEVAGGSYARVAMSPAAGTWDAPAGSGATQNTGAITFPTPSGAWGVVTHFANWDAASGGNCWIYGALSASRSPASGDTVRFVAGALDITVD